MLGAPLTWPLVRMLWFNPVLKCLNAKKTMPSWVKDKALISGRRKTLLFSMRMLIWLRLLSPSALSILHLDCQCLGMTQVVLDLCALLQRLVPKLGFLSEMKKSKTKIEHILHDLHDFFGIFVDTRGQLAFRLWEYLLIVNNLLNLVCYALL